MNLRLSRKFGNFIIPTDFHSLSWIYPLKIVIFHSYVSLPEGVYIYVCVMIYIYIYGNYIEGFIYIYILHSFDISRCNNMLYHML